MINITGQNFTPREIIQNVFSPLVGVLSSQHADDLCQKNNLTFVEMLQPFSKLTSDAHFRDTSGTSVSVKGLRLNVCDVGWRPPQTILARKMLNEAVTNGFCDKTKEIQAGGMILNIPASEPWFDQWRETFLTVQFPADHEFTRHFLSSLIVLSSSDPNILDTATQLTKKINMLQNVTPQKLPKWFSNDVLNCYVLLHDGLQGDITKAQQSYELLKSTFGENKCFLVQINSVKNPIECPDPWLRYIKRQPKSEVQSDTGSTPKTPQDVSSVTAMPTVHNEPISEGEVFVHPLSPIQEQATEAIHSKFSGSSDSINSQTLNPNVWASEFDVDVPHGVWLTSQDVENLRHFVQDYTVRALIPYVEKLVGTLNEAITNKKGVSRSLLSATKRWFVANKPGVGASVQNAVIYTAESTELQTRKLGDLYFMFGNYNLAFQAYHQAKRDFNADSAWQYYAGALEMAALSAFMLGTGSRKTYDYMEDAIVSYLNVCKLPQFATRATLMSVECLKSVRLYGEAAKQLMRMTSEDSDLRSALLLEQAAYCFLMAPQPMHRKYAFHIVLAGNRYSRAGQRKHAFRCYKQAYQVFENRGWNLAEDHIQYTIGKQAVTLKKLDVACASLAHLLRPTSLQNVVQQAAFLREYIATQKELLSQNPVSELPEIYLPKVIQPSLRILVTSHPPVSNPLYFTAATHVHIDSLLKDESKWEKLEEMIVQSTSNRPIVFKTLRSLFTAENPTIESPLGIHGEPIELSVALANTIKPSIMFSEINILWEFTTTSNSIITNKTLYERECSYEEKEMVAEAITSTTIDEIILNEHEEKVIHMKITPKLVGKLKIMGILGRMSAANESGSLRGWIKFEPQSIRVTEKSPSADKSLQFDNKLNIEILPPAPSLHVSFSPVSTDVLCGEIIPVNMCLKNPGLVALRDIYVCCESPRWLIVPNETMDIPLSILREYKDLPSENLSKDRETRKQHVFRLLKKVDEITLMPEESATIPLWIQAPYQKGEFRMRLLIYYAMPQEYPRIRYRLIRHEWVFNVDESLQAEVSCVISNLVTNDLAIDVNLKNLNQSHQTLLTELTVDAIHLYCDSYKLNNSKLIYLNDTELSFGHLNEKCLKSSKSMSFRCRLSEKICDKQDNILTSIRNKNSEILLNSNSSLGDSYPTMDTLDNFLIKNETKYFGLNISVEEFNNIVASRDPHMTVAISWKALVDQKSVQRIGYGQNFVQLRNLYEQVFCPETADYRVKTYLGDHPVYHKIFEFKEHVTAQDDEDDNQWEFNNNFVGKRCLLEDDNTMLCKNVKDIANVA